MTTILHFNTGRLYAAHGQRITVIVHPYEKVVFFDHSRMVSGEFPYQRETISPSQVMFAYDNSIHTHTRESKPDFDETGDNDRHLKI